MRIGLLADAHGNREAFDAAREVLDRFAVSQIYFLGDAVGYFPGSDVVARLVAEGIPAILGNHEAMLLDGAPVRDDVYRLRATAAAMPKALLAAVRTWPDHRWIESGPARALLVHGSPTDRLWGYVYPDTDLAPFATMPALLGATVFMANTHRPFVRRSATTTFVNVGSCGLPRDCGRLGACCVYDSTTGDVRILRFDITDATTTAIVRCGGVHDQVLRTVDRAEPEPIGELV